MRRILGDNMIGDGEHARVIKDFMGACRIIAIGDNAARKKEDQARHGALWDIAIHPFSYVSEDVRIGEGTVIMAGAVVQPGAWIGRHVIINTGATVDHDCLVDNYAHIAPGAHLCGNVHVGEGALVGVGVGIAPGKKIPAWTLVKAKEIILCPMK